jgi:hypothetical protein
VPYSDPEMRKAARLASDRKRRARAPLTKFKEEQEAARKPTTEVADMFTYKGP